MGDGRYQTQSLRLRRLHLAYCMNENNRNDLTFSHSFIHSCADGSIEHHRLKASRLKNNRKLSNRKAKKSHSGLWEEVLVIGLLMEKILLLWIGCREKEEVAYWRWSHMEVWLWSKLGSLCPIELNKAPWYTSNTTKLYYCIKLNLIWA